MHRILPLGGRERPAGYLRSVHARPPRSPRPHRPRPRGARRARRMLAYVYREPDGLFVNAELVRRGYARVLTIPPNVAHEAEFRRLARHARAAGRGLWSRC